MNSTAADRRKRCPQGIITKCVLLTATVSTVEVE